jgi:hypothetical protein
MSSKTSNTVNAVGARAREIACAPPYNSNSHLLMLCSEEDFNKAKELAAEAVKSGAYLYPIKARKQHAKLILSGC